MFCCDKRVKREVVVRKNESVGGGKDYIEKWEVPSQEVLGSLCVRVTANCQGCSEGYVPNTDEIRWLSDDQIRHCDKLVWYIYDDQ